MAGNTSTTSVFPTKPCKPCNGQGILWGPEGADKNWSFPSIPTIPSIPSFPPHQIPLPLIPSFDDFQDAIDRHLEETKEKTFKEEIEDALKNKRARRMKL